MFPFDTSRNVGQKRVKIDGNTEEQGEYWVSF